MPLSEEKKTHKNMRILRLRFDEVDRQYQSILKKRKPLKSEVEEYVEILRGLIDRACRNSGFKSRPVLIDRSTGRQADIGEVSNKGRVRRR